MISFPSVSYDLFSKQSFIDFLDIAQKKVVSTLEWCAKNGHVELVDPIVRIGKKIQLISRPFIHGIRFVGILSTCAKIKGLVYGKLAYKHESSDRIDLLKAASIIFFIHSEILEHIKVVSEIGLIQIRSFKNSSISFVLRGYSWITSVETIQASCVSIGFGLNIIDAIRKIWKNKKMYLSDILLVSVNAVFIASSIADRLPMSYAKIISIALQVFGGILQFIQWVFELKEYNPLLLSKI